MPTKTVTRAKFARMAGVTPSSVTKAAEASLKPAIVGNRIDADHPAAIQYMERNSLTKTIQNPGEGVDPLHDEAVALCRSRGRASAAAIKRELNVGITRAMKIRDAIIALGIDLSSDPEPEPYARGGAIVKAAKKEAAIPPPTETDGTIDVPEDVGSFLDLTLRDLIDKFGTDAQFVDWLSATQKIEAINEKRLKNAATKGELISRELVSVGVIGVFNAAHLRLLKDGAKSIAAGVISKHSTGAELSEVEAYVSDILGSFIKPVKSKISRALKNG